jgi:hypothetical protein
MSAARRLFYRAKSKSTDWVFLIHIGVGAGAEFYRLFESILFLCICIYASSTVYHSFYTSGDYLQHSSLSVLKIIIFECVANLLLNREPLIAFDGFTMLLCRENNHHFIFSKVRASSTA